MKYLKYRIYIVDEKGMLSRPKNFFTESYTYDDFDTMEEAYEAVENYTEYVVLPIIQKWEDE